MIVILVVVIVVVLVVVVMATIHLHMKVGVEKVGNIGDFLEMEAVLEISDGVQGYETRGDKPRSATAGDGFGTSDG